MKGTSKRYRILVPVIEFILVAWIASSCVTTGPAPPDSYQEEGDLEDIQKRLVDSAYWALGRNRLNVEGKCFNLDCSGVVLAIYDRSGKDLQPFMASYSGGGVQRLYALMEEQGLLYKTKHPAPGDLLFWDNTYDRNKNGKKDDLLTHIGMVVSMDNKGNVKYIHHNYRKGIILENMNLTDPDNLEKNSPIRARGAEKGHAPRWLSGQLLKASARAYKVK